MGSGSGPGNAAQANSNVTQILVDCSTCNVLAVTSQYPSTINGFQFNVTVAARPHTGIGIYGTATGAAVKTSNWRIQNNGFTNIDTPIRFLKPDWPTISGNYFDGWKSAAVYCETDATAEGACGHINNNYFFGTVAYTGYPVYSEVGYTQVYANEILGGPAGVFFNIKNYPAGYLQVLGNTIENFSTAGVIVADGDHTQPVNMVMIQNNEFSELTQTATSSVLIAEDTVNPTYIADISITGNTSRLVSKAGVKHVWVQAGKNVKIADNVIDELGLNTPVGIQISGATVNTGFAQPIAANDNTFIGTLTRYSFASQAAPVLRDTIPIALGSVPSNVGEASQMFFTSTVAGSSPCGAGAQSAMAFRQNNAWKCF